MESRRETIRKTNLKYKKPSNRIAGDARVSRSEVVFPSEKPLEDRVAEVRFLRKKGWKLKGYHLEGPQSGRVRGHPGKRPLALENKDIQPSLNC